MSMLKHMMMQEINCLIHKINKYSFFILNMNEPINNINFMEEVTPKQQKKPVGRPRKNPINMDDMNRGKSVKMDEENEDRLHYYSELLQMYEEYASYLSDYKLRVTVNSPIEEMQKAEIEMRRIIVSKEAKKLPNIFHWSFAICKIFQRFGFLDETIITRLQKFKQILIDNYSMLEPEFNELMMKYPSLITLTSGIPVELSLALKLHSLWMQLDDPLEEKNDVKIDNRFNDL